MRNPIIGRGYFKNRLKPVMNITRRDKRKSSRDSKRDKFYQSRDWKKDVDFVWERDKHMCQECLDRGRRHYLVRGTKDIDRQGTVDHDPPRPRNAPYNPETYDHVDNLRLIGSRHHASKSSRERSNINRT